MLCEQRNYINKDIDCLYNTYIREYDMQSAGLNVIYREKLISDAEYNYLRSLNKIDMNIKIGWMQRGNKVLVEGLAKGMARVRQEFIEANKLVDSDILSIKNDAIFVINKLCSRLKFDNVEFKNKNTYTSYYYLDGKEFYYIHLRGKSTIHVKGIDDTLVERHKPGMIGKMCEIFRAVEVQDSKAVFNKIKDFAFKYKEGKLPIEYYRELTSTSMFRLKHKLIDNDIGLREFGGSVDELIISYNYRAIILELLNLFG